jgi:hypothetical protein
MEYIDIIDTDSEISKSSDSSDIRNINKPKYVQPYISSRIIENKTNDNKQYIIEDNIEPNIKNIKDNKLNLKPIYPYDEMDIIYNFNNDVKSHIKSNIKFKQDDCNDYGFLKAHPNKCRLWFNDINNPEDLIWIISNKLPELNKQSKHTIKNGTKYLDYNLELNDNPYEWNIKNHNNWFYISNNNDYLTFNDKIYRFPDSIYIHPLDNNSNTSKRLNQLWIIEPDPNIFTRKNLDQVLNHSNKNYLTKFMEDVPPMEKLKLYAEMNLHPTEKIKYLTQLASMVPFDERQAIMDEINRTKQNDQTPDIVLFLRSMTNNFIIKNPYIDIYDAIQFVSKYLSDEAEKVREDIRPQYIKGGKLLRNMYENEIKLNPNQNKKTALKKCIDSIMK